MAIQYNDYDIEWAKGFDEILTNLGGTPPDDDEVFDYMCENKDDIAANAYYELILRDIENEIEEKYPDAEVSYYVNARDTKLYINGEQVYDWNDAQPLLTGGEIYEVEYWETEEDRDMGEGNMYMLSEEEEVSKEKSIQRAKNLFSKQNFASVEVLDEDGSVVFHISTDEPKGESYAKGGVLYGVEYKEKPTDRKFKKTSLQMANKEAIVKNANLLKKQEGWSEIRIVEEKYAKGGRTSKDYSKWENAMYKFNKAKEKGDKAEMKKQSQIINSITKNYAKGGETDTEIENDIEFDNLSKFENHLTKLDDVSHNYFVDKAFDNDEKKQEEFFEEVNELGDNINKKKKRYQKQKLENYNKGKYAKGGMAEFCSKCGGEGEIEIKNHFDDGRGDYVWEDCDECDNSKGVIWNDIYDKYPGSKYYMDRTQLQGSPVKLTIKEKTGEKTSSGRDIYKDTPIKTYVEKEGLFYEEFAKGGEIKRFDRHESMPDETRDEISYLLNGRSEDFHPYRIIDTGLRAAKKNEYWNEKQINELRNYLFGLYDGYNYSHTEDFKKVLSNLKKSDIKTGNRVEKLFNEVDKYPKEEYSYEYAKGGKVFKAPKGWRKTRQDEGEKTYKHKDGREIIVSESWRGTPSFEVKWEVEKSYNWEDWKRKKFPMTKEGTKEMEEFLTKLMSSSYAKGGKIKVVEKPSGGMAFSKTFPQGEGRAYQSAKNRIKDLGDKFDKVMIDNKEISLKEFDSLEGKFENQSFAKGGEILSKEVFEWVEVYKRNNQEYYDNLNEEVEYEEEKIDLNNANDLPEVFFLEIREKLEEDGYSEEEIDNAIEEYFKKYYDEDEMFITKYYAKGGEVNKKENNEMLIGGLAGILLGIFLNK